jgi:hypothetical protein
MRERQGGEKHTEAPGRYLWRTVVPFGGRRILRADLALRIVVFKAAERWV